MTLPSVVDANCLKYYQQERVAGREGEFTVAISKLMAKGALAIDSEGKALQEYYDCCRPSAVGLNLSDWISERLVDGCIKMFDTDNSLTRELLSLGLPRKDIKWPCIAKSSNSDIIVTEDIDLFEPTAKSRRAPEKERIKRARTGCVCRHLERQHSIRVLTSQHVRDEY